MTGALWLHTNILRCLIRKSEMFSHLIPILDIIYVYNYQKLQSSSLSEHEADNISNRNNLQMNSYNAAQPAEWSRLIHIYQEEAQNHYCFLFSAVWSDGHQMMSSLVQWAAPCWCSEGTPVGLHKQTCWRARGGFPPKPTLFPPAPADSGSGTTAEIMLGFFFSI